ncbi:RPM1-interacting protein 4-like [Euphorbia lathyris]|uniref:RPM1-interacting protein 4-like n=1 Tax=Euphorbia lathyris TaxID=212925 RepID=UPI0033141CD4
MAQRSHVPKFGNWESDNIPYTAYFENARKDKTGVNQNVMINPNDPQQNPQAFLNFGRESQVELSFSQKKINIATTSSESGQSSDYYSALRRPGKSDSTEEGHGSSISTSSVVSRNHRKTSESHPSANNRHERAASIPKFGAWDEADPSSGVGFTVIFNKVKEEKRTKLPPSLTHTTQDQDNQTSPVHESKFCCGLFSYARKEKF